ncbi:sensor histidine kinase [Mesobacillus foraminis]|uniref:histidine kinase n=1 Tax=Mesobacillus foraminis TaxID=279826 RepID=A0A4R2BID5_9BACI|nr:HAMP domain-containing sensor histidine kinase [Mesobacillus foraminis]TCN26343.1 two-component system sporulation sensor kinase B [Mesobacillus foraminis]
MKEFYSHIDKKIYYSIVFIIIAIMMIGLFVENPYFGAISTGYIFQIAQVILLSACLLLYPKYETRLFRMMIMMVLAFYFYTLFFLYPGTWSTFIFLCLMPAFSILYFDPKLFYFSLLLNNLSILFIFGFITFSDFGNFYPYIKLDPAGNVINFIGSQIIIYFIFYISYRRIKKQQVYFEQIQHAERMKTTGQLAAAVAHEIRNPLTVVKGFLQLYEEDPSFSKEKKRHFTLMVDELNTAEQVISQFLSIAKPNMEPETESVDVKAVLQSVTDLLHSYGLLHDNQIELKVEEDCYIAANTIEFKQLLINIIKNAIEASEFGGSVLLTADRNKDVATIKVTDFGHGMSEEEVKALGTPFYSLKSKGTGLGMMICYNIAEKYNGTISIQSTKGKGTTVIIQFPLAKNQG